MDILYGDPFYHNIIHHLPIPDIYRLKCVCSSYNKNITQPLINKITINNIKKHLHKIFGNNYDENIKNIKEICLNKIDPNPNNKYFVISILRSNVSTKKFDVSNRVKSLLTIKNDIFDTINYGYMITPTLSSFSIILYFETLPDDDPNILTIKKQCWGHHNENYDLFWIENDNNKPFNLLDHL